jgi:hypothetical protein
LINVDARSFPFSLASSTGSSRWSKSLHPSSCASKSSVDSFLTTTECWITAVHNGAMISIGAVLRR